jgi:hypothetical protein
MVGGSRLRAASVRQLNARTIWLPSAAVAAGISFGVLLPVGGSGLLQYELGGYFDAVVTGLLVGGSVGSAAVCLARISWLSLQAISVRRLAGFIMMWTLLVVLAAELALALLALQEPKTVRLASGGPHGQCGPWRPPQADCRLGRTGRTGIRVGAPLPRATNGIVSRAAVRFA